MKNRLLIVAVILIVLGIGLWAVARGGGSERDNLVPAWLLTPKGMYSGDSLLDPMMSWSPDSSSLLLSVKSNKTSKPWILHWKAGEKQLERVTFGVSPNFIGKDAFLYLIQNPYILAERNLTTGIDTVIIKDFRRVEFWKDITSFSYLPERKTLALRLSGLTRYYEPGLEEIDLTGKPIGRIARTTGNGVLDRSTDPEKKQVAEIMGELTGGDRILQICRGGESVGKQVARGDLGAVAWSPDGKTIAFADGNEVKVADPAGEKIATIARFAPSSDVAQAPYVCRLCWSPDSRYVVAIELIPNDVSGDVMAYVLDMSKLNH